MEAFPTTRRIKLVEKNEFAAIELDLEHEIFVVYIALLTSSTSVYLSYKP